MGPKLAVAGASAVVGAEILHWWASRSCLSDAPPSYGADRTGVIVLGHRPRRDGSIHPLALWRVHLAQRAFRLLQPEVVVFTGGAPGRLPTEAWIMAAAALDIGLPSQLVRTEEASSNTWENIAFSLPLVERCNRLAIVSDPMHAARGRRNLVAQRPGLAGRLVSAGDYAFLEHCWLKTLTAAYELPKLFKPDLSAPSKLAE